MKTLNKPNTLFNNKYICNCADCKIADKCESTGNTTIFCPLGHKPNWVPKENIKGELNMLNKPNTTNFEITATADGIYGIKRGTFVISEITDDKAQLETIVDLLNSVGIQRNNRVFELILRCLDFKEKLTYSVVKTKVEFEGKLHSTYGIAVGTQIFEDIATTREGIVKIKNFLNKLSENDNDTLKQFFAMYVDYEDII